MHWPSRRRRERRSTSGCVTIRRRSIRLPCPCRNPSNKRWPRDAPPAAARPSRSSTGVRVSRRQGGTPVRGILACPMANILYGVNGEGAGHSTRAKEVLTHLVSQGHTVHVASFDRGLENLSHDFDVIEIYGFRFAYVNNRVRYKRTIAKNLVTAPHAAKSLSQLNDLVEAGNINLVITDFEPLTCHVGHKRRLPVISIDNQHCLTNAVVSYPGQYRRDAAAAKLVTKLMTPRANAYLVISFFTAPIRKRNTFLFPPLLREEILQAKSTESDHVLVYVTSPAPALTKLLSSVRCQFIAYGFAREVIDG